MEDIGRLKLITDSEFQKLVGKQEEGAGESDKKVSPARSALNSLS